MTEADIPLRAEPVTEPRTFASPVRVFDIWTSTEEKRGD